MANQTAQPNDLDDPKLESIEATDPMEVIENDDGSATVNFNPEDDESQETPDFGANLVATLEDLDSLASELIDLIESDQKSSALRDKQYADGIKRTGLSMSDEAGASFEGSSKAVHPMLAKGCVDFASRAIKELFPAGGPCKTQIIGEANDAKLDKADRKKRYMNWQMTTQVPEQRPEFERLLSQVPLGGSQYKRWWWDAQLERPRTETVYVDDVFIPYSCADFYTAYRVTHRQWVSKNEFEARIESELYADIRVGNPPTSADVSESKKATDKIDGIVDDSAYNDEGQREIYLSYVDLMVEDDSYADGRVVPYIAHIDKDTRKMLGMYRNWKQEDDRYAKKHWMVEYGFIPWRGAKSVGLYHLIGSLSTSGTGALRALLDSAFISNFPGGLKLKGGRTAGQSIQVNATELAEIDAPAGTDDIRKIVMPFPFNGPSNVLFTLLEWLTGQAEGVIATASEKIADAGANMPVGTALALIEHGSINFSAIHARAHNSLKREMEILHRLNAENMTDEETVEELGELVVSRSDFQGPMDVIPVSDPNIFSEAQRYAQVQAVMQLADRPDFARFFKPDRLLQRTMRVLQIPWAEDIANLPKDPKRLGALEENYQCCATEPSPIKVYHEQDDVAHLEGHLHFMVSPMFGANPLIAPIALPPLVVHCREHLMNFYHKHSAAAADALMMIAPGAGGPIPREVAEAKGSAFADKIMAQLLGPMIMPSLEQAQKLALQFAQKPPPDPSVLVEQARGQNSQALKQLELQHQQQMAQQTAQMEQMKAQIEVAEADKDRQLKITLRDKELMEEHLQWQGEQDQNDRATATAAALEQRTIESSEQLAQFSADVKAADQQREAYINRDQEQMKADNEAQMLVLAELIKEQTRRLQPPPIDLSSVVAPLLQAVQGNAQAMAAQLAEGLSVLHATTKAPRIAKYIRDEAGNTVGVESVVKE